VYLTVSRLTAHAWYGSLYANMIHAIRQQLFNEIPMIVVSFGAIVTAFVLWRRAPVSSLLVVLASISTLVLLIAYPFAYEAAVHLLASNAQSADRIQIAFGVGWSIARAGYLILLVVAVYAGRKEPEMLC
jgi:hypothetical protein